MIPFIPAGLVSKIGSFLTPVAAKLASPLAKLGIVAALLLVTNLYTWHHTTVEMTRECEEGKRIFAEEQAKVQAAQDAKVIEERETIYRERNETKRVSDEKITDLKKRMAIYERNAKLANIPAPPGSRAMFDAISGLFPPVTQLPTASASAGESDESSKARVEITRLLLAYVNAYGHCGEELTSLWDDYSALVKAVRSQSVIEKG